jgi:hypothetical protein
MNKVMGAITFHKDDPDYFRHEMRVGRRYNKEMHRDITEIFNNITEMYQRCNHKHIDIQ